MIRPEQIPDEVVKAAARKQAELDNVEWQTLNDVAIKLRCDHARAVLAAGLVAWPGSVQNFNWDGSRWRIVLPMTQEKSNGSD